LHYDNDPIPITNKMKNYSVSPSASKPNDTKQVQQNQNRQQRQ